MIEDLKVLVAEDEDPFREEIVAILKGYPQIKEITEIMDGGSLRNELMTNKYDIAFLDVDLPVCTSFEAISNIKTLPVLVFITAYDEYISNALDLNAADYILKPFDEKKLHRSVLRALEIVKKNNKEKPKAGLKGVIWLKGEKERLVPVPLSSIVFIEANSGETIVYTEKNKFISSKPMKEFYSLLNPKLFVYTHRSYIIKLNQIRYLETLSNNLGEITLINRPEKIPVSRRYLKEITSHIY